MAPEPQVHELGPDVSIWQRYDPKVKAELSSTAISTDAGTYLIDPIALGTPALKRLVAKRSVAGVIVTNENHARAAAEFGQSFGVPIYTSASPQPAIADVPVRLISEGADMLPGLCVIELTGGAPGEIALHDARDTGTIIVGDALINFGSNEFAVLPAKYCENAKLLRKSLHKLLGYKFERLLFAHGGPILSHGRSRLADLLDARN